MGRMTQRAQELEADVAQNMPGRHSQTREEFHMQGVFSTRWSAGQRRVLRKDWDGEGRGPEKPQEDRDIFAQEHMLI